MKRSLAIAFLAAAAAALITDSASAGHHHRRACCAPQPTCCTPAPSCSSTPATVAPQPAAAPQDAPAPAPPQANNANGYQSYSFEPGATIPPAPAAVIPQRALRTPNSFYDQIRADRKVTGR